MVYLLFLALPRLVRIAEMLDGCVSRKETQRWKQEYGDFENKSGWKTVVVREYVDVIHGVCARRR